MFKYEGVARDTYNLIQESDRVTYILYHTRNAKNCTNYRDNASLRDYWYCSW